MKHDLTKAILALDSKEARVARFETEMLISPMRGVYLVTTYYSDGSKVEREVPKGKLIIPCEIYDYGNGD